MSKEGRCSSISFVSFEHVIAGWALTNCSKNTQDKQVLETGLRDFHKMTDTLLETLYVKQKLNTVFYRS